jgi:adenylosuccinate lyase
LIVQNAALKAWEEEGSFKDNIMKDTKIAKLLNKSEMESLFDVNYHLKNIDVVFERLKNI